MRKINQLLAAAVLCVIANSAHSNFFDQGFIQTPVIRTDYVSQYAGTSTAPLTISGCHFNQSSCPTLNSVFSQSNYWTMNWNNNCLPGFCPPYWTVTMNNENANDNVDNSGPPDVSLPHSWPGSGIMGFNALYGSANFPGDTYWRAHLVLNLGFTNPQYGAIPFLGFGAFANHGNGQNLGYLNPTSGNPSYLKFDARLWGSTLPTSINGVQPGTIVSWVQVFVNWGAHPKAVQIALFHQSTGGSSGYLATRTLAPALWDWRYQQSAYYPGAEFASTRAEDLSFYCAMSVPSLVLNTDVHYSINLQTLFQCMSNQGMFHDGLGVNDPLPGTSNLPVTIVNWANEGTGINGALWTDVHNMSMSTTP